MNGMSLMCLACKNNVNSMIVTPGYAPTHAFMRDLVLFDCLIVERPIHPGTRIGRGTQAAFCSVCRNGAAAPSRSGGHTFSRRAHRELVGEGCPRPHRGSHTRCHQRTCRHHTSGKSGCHSHATPPGCSGDGDSATWHRAPRIAGDDVTAQEPTPRSAAAPAGAYIRGVPAAAIHGTTTFCVPEQRGWMPWQRCDHGGAGLIGARYA